MAESLQPDHRFTHLSEGGKPNSKLEKTVQKSMKTGAPDEYDYALSINKDATKREILEAFLLARATEDQVCETLRIPKGVYAVYTAVFFDVSVFKDRLDTEAYIEAYPDDYGKSLKMCAITLGMDFLLFRYGGTSEINVTDILRSIIESANILASAARINPINSTTSREARQWMSTAIKAIETFSKVAPKMESNDDEWHLVLKELNDSVSAENSDIGPTDLVH